MEGSPDPRTDGELLVASVTDPEAFAVFYRRHVRGVLSFFRRRVASAEVAFHLTAETFAAALEATPRYQPRPEPARGWLYGIAWNKLNEAKRRGCADDAARRGLAMAPIELTDAGVARIEALAGGGRLRLIAAPLTEQIRASLREGKL
jgi:DNA-directed RNA polymerase specialized sigma24 family protein